MSRILGIDYGEKRIGLAISDPLRMTAQALGYILNDSSTIKNLQSRISEYDVQHIVVGLPLNQNGEDSAKCQYVREFCDEIASHTSVPYSFWDERFSTVAVTKQLIDADMSRKKRKEVVDAQAAAFILQGYLDSLVSR